MAITSYETLQSTVSRWAGGSSDTAFAEAIRDAIDLTESELDRELRIPEMVTRATANCNEAYETLPAGVMKLISICPLVNGVEGLPLKQIAEDAAPAYAARYTSGAPKYFALVATQARLIPAPTATNVFKARIVFYGQVPRLSAAIPCNAVLLAARDAYLYGSLSHLGEYVEDGARLQRFDARFRNAIRSLNRMSVTRDGTLAA